MPGVKQPCPIVAACWSPAMPRMRIAPPNRSGRVSPKSAAQSPHLRQQRRPGRRTAAAAPGPMRRGRYRTAACATHWSHRWRGPCRRSAARAGTNPPCRMQAGPARPPRAHRSHCRAASRSWSPRNTDRARRPVLSATAASCPAPRSAAQASAVRRSCQTMALWIGLPLTRSQTIVVSRWLVMPMPAISLASTAALAIASRTVATTLDQISSGSCSTHPGAG